MKNLALTLCVPVLVLAAGFRATPNPEHEAVRRAVLDYVEGFYEAKPELIERGVHPDLVKYGYWRSNPEDEYHGTAMTFDEAVEAAKEWNADGTKVTDETPREIEIFDVADQTACAKLTAAWGIDYFQLARTDGAWKIRHVLWQSAPPEQARATEAGSER